MIPDTLPDLTGVKVLSLDGETYDKDLKKLGPGFITRSSYPIGFSYYADNGESGYVPIAHDEGNVIYDWQTWLRTLLKRTDLIVCMANAKYDLEWLWLLGINPSCTVIDIQTQEALIDENQYRYDLDSIGKRRCLGGKVELPIGVKMDDLRYVPPNVLASYAVRDAELTYKIYLQQLEDINKQDLTKVALLESKLIKVLFKMRVQGVRVDVSGAELLNEQLKMTGTSILLPLIADTSEFEPWSSASVANWLRRQGISHFPQTDSDNPKDSITNEWLLGQTQSEPCQKLAEFRKLEKFRRDFIEGVILDTNHNEVLHPSWFSTRGSSYQSGGDANGTRSGRIACVLPNLTQMPSRHPVYGPMLRRLFLPWEGERWAKLDVSSQEPRILVHYASLMGLTGADEVRQRYISDSKTDFHQEVTNMVNRVRSEPILRSQGKTINLGLAYGMGVTKMSNALGLPIEETKELLDAYHSGVPFVRQLTRACQDRADSLGYIRTYLGRRRHFDGWENGTYGAEWSKPIPYEQAKAKWGKIKREGTFKAANSVIQGTAAEQTKTAILNLSEQDIYPLIQVYDELSISASDMGQALKVKEALENALTLSVPMLAEGFLAKDWAGTDKVVI